MRELARFSISAVPVPFVPIVAEGFSLTVSSRLLPFAFAFPFAAAFSTLWSGPALLPKPLWGVFVNLCRSGLPLGGPLLRIDSTSFALHQVGHVCP